MNKNPNCSFSSGDRRNPQNAEPSAQSPHCPFQDHQTARVLSTRPRHPFWRGHASSLVHIAAGKVLTAVDCRHQRRSIPLYRSPHTSARLHPLCALVKHRHNEDHHTALDMSSPRLIRSLFMQIEVDGVFLRVLCVSVPLLGRVKATWGVFARADRITKTGQLELTVNIAMSITTSFKTILSPAEPLLS